MWVNAEKVTPQTAEEVIGRLMASLCQLVGEKRGAEGMIAAADYARQQKIPYLGLC